MNEQRNLFLAIGISIAIIVIFQVLFPVQTIQETNTAVEEILEPVTVGEYTLS